MKYSNVEIHKICKVKTVTAFIEKLPTSYLAHIVRKENDQLVKQLTFDSVKAKVGGKQYCLKQQVLGYHDEARGSDENNFYKNCIDRKF